ncbi:glycosyltransferase [Hymenobacter sp. HMF4947]|uniref:Glycosyltransferase n=1 Tax=Hymenobacter ginkgonis TaxID=2682976 RepID=A0A7K1TKT9_9BACT|nr:glycosyltransferase [Hymenobacter ginkgonis]MVN78993.1 glycosyltransferase [Hymenobacter ginkgonis]
MDVSVIIINYNTFKLTCEAIASIQAYTKGVSYEIVLVDNASTECDPISFTERFGESIKLICNPVNSGFAKGNNLGIEYAVGDTILLFNSDAACLNDALTLTYKALQANAKLGITTARLEYPNGQLQYQCGRFPSLRLQLLELLRLQKLMGQEQTGRILQGGFFDHLSELEPDWVWGTYFHFRRSILTELPGGHLPDEFFMYAEDLEWSYAIRKLGYAIRYVPAARVLHHFSQSTKQEKKLNQQRMILQNEDTFLRREYGELHTKAYYLARWLTLRSTRGENGVQLHLANQYARLLRGKELL